MPTGYTAKLMDEGQTFQEFTLGCARAFGALISMRDDPSDAQIPDEFAPSGFHEQRLAEAHEELARLRAMSLKEEIAFFGRTEKDKDLTSTENLLRGYLEQNNRIDEMAERVRAWYPPTSEHQGLKDFMLQQLEISYNSTKYLRDQLREVTAKLPMDYYISAVAQAERNIRYHAKEHAKEVQRANERTAWVRQLKESLQ